MNLSETSIELSEAGWLEKIREQAPYMLCSVKIQDPLSTLTTLFKNSLEQKKSHHQAYQVYYTELSDSIKAGFQVIDSKVSGFTLIHDKQFSQSDLLNMLGEPTGKTPVIGQVFSMWSYEIEGYIYDYDAFDLKVKLDETEQNITAFYFGKQWSTISLESFPSEIR